MQQNHTINGWFQAFGLAVFALVTTFSFSTAARAQSAQEILQTTLERYEQRMQGIKNYTVVYEGGPLGGMQIYYEREMADGHPVYRPVIAGLPKSVGGKSGTSDAYLFFDKIASRARLAGTETVEGHRTYVIEVEDLQGTDLWAAPEGTSGFEPRSATFWIDAERYVPRRMIIEGVANAGGEPRSVVLEGHMSDYREVAGMLYPFRASMSFEGLLSGAQQKQMSEAMEKLREQLEQMPPAQRKQMKRMLGGQIADMMGAGGEMTFTTKVKELRVNEGPPQ